MAEEEQEEVLTLGQIEALPRSAEEDTDLPIEDTPMSLGDIMSMEREHKAPMGEIFEVSPEQRQAWLTKGKIGYWEQAQRTDLTEMLPFNPESSYKGIKLLAAVDTIQDPNAKPEEYADAVERVNRYLEKTNEENIRGFTIGGKVIQGVSVLPGYMIEFAATGGLAAIARGAVKKGIKSSARKIVKSQILKAVTRVTGGAAGHAAGAVARTAVMPHKFTESFADRQANASLELTDKGLEFGKTSRESPAISALKALGDVFIENFSEVLGPAIGKGASFIGKKTGYLMPLAFKTNLEKLFLKLHPNEAVKNLWTKTGYDGFLQELGEERVGAFLRAMTGVEDFGAKDPDSMIDRIWESIPNAEELLVESLVLAFPGVGRLGVSATVEHIRKRKFEQQVIEPELQLLREDQLDALAATTEERIQALPGAPQPFVTEEGVTAAPPAAPAAIEEIPEIAPTAAQPLDILAAAEQALGERALPEALTSQLETLGVDTEALDAIFGDVQARVDEGSEPGEAFAATLADRGVQLPAEITAQLSEEFQAAQEAEIAPVAVPQEQISGGLVPGQEVSQTLSPEIAALGLPVKLASDPSLTGLVKNVKALSGAAQLQHPIAETLRQHMTSKEVEGMTWDQAVEHNLNLQAPVINEILANPEAILKMPDPVRARFRDSLGRYMTYRALLTGEEIDAGVVEVYESIDNSLAPAVEDVAPEGLPERPPSDRWTTDPGAIPGEATHFLDVVDGDLDTARAVIAELERGGYEVILHDGSNLPNRKAELPSKVFETLESAAAEAENVLGPFVPGDSNFDFGANVEAKPADKTDLAAASPSEITLEDREGLKERFGDLDPKIVEDIYRAGLAAGKPISQELGEAGAEIAEEVQREMALEDQMQDPETHKLLRVILKAGGLTPATYNEHKGELQNIPPRSIVRKEGGLSIDGAREILEQEKLLPEGSTVNDVLVALDKESRDAWTKNMPKDLRDARDLEYGDPNGGEFDVSPENADRGDFPKGPRLGYDVKAVKEGVAPPAKPGKKTGAEKWRFPELYEKYPSNLLGKTRKLEKGEKVGWLTKSLSFLPAMKQLGFLPPNVRISLLRKTRCPNATEGCSGSCINTSGYGNYPETQAARARRTHLWLNNPEVFFQILSAEIHKEKLIAKLAGTPLALRLDNFSDVGLAERMAKIHPDVQFYDYTKVPGRYRKFLAGKMPKNLHLTFSRSEKNDKQSLKFLGQGGSVAVVFAGKVPKKWNGYRVISGSDTDLRFLDREIFKIPKGKGFVIGLSVSGSGKTIGVDTGFVIKTDAKIADSLTESEIAFQGKSPLAEVSKVADEVDNMEMPDKGKMRESDASDDLRSDGYIDYRGRKVLNSRQAAEIIATARDPKIEHFSVIFTKGGRVVGHQIYSSGAPDLVNVPGRLRWKIQSAFLRLGADGIWFGHNHPSGQIKTSPEDRDMTRSLARQFPASFKGHVVTDHDEYSIINAKGNTRKTKFAKPKKKFVTAEREAKPRITGPMLAAVLTRHVNKLDGLFIVYLDATSRVISMERVREGINIPQTVRQQIKALGAAKVIISKSQRIRIEPGSLPSRVIDVIDFLPGNKAVSRHQAKTLDVLLEAEDPELASNQPGFYRVQEDAPAYNADEFQMLLIEKGIKLGSTITIRERLEEPTAKQGFITKGRKVRVVGIDKQNPLLLVHVGGILPMSGDELYVALGPQAFSETYVRPKTPPRRKPGLVKREVRKITGQVQEKEVPTVGQFQAFKELLKAQEKAQRLTLNEVRDVQSKLIALIEQTRIPAEDRSKFIRFIKNIQTPEQFEAALPEITERVDSLIEAAAKRKTLSAISKELQKVKPRRQAGRLVGRFTPTIQDILSRMREIDKMTQAEAAEKLELNLAQDESGSLAIPTPITAIENKMLNAVAKRGDLTASELGDILNIIRALKLGGNQLRKLKQFKDMAALEEQRDIASSIIDSRPATQLPTTGDESADDTAWGWWNRATGWLIGWDNLMNRLSWADKSTTTNQSKLNKMAEVATAETDEKRGLRQQLGIVRRMWEAAFGQMSDSQLERRWAAESEEKVIGTFLNNRGQMVELRISKAQARKRWMEFQDPSLFDTIFGVSEHSMGWTQDMRAAVENTLSPQDLQFAQAQMEFYRSYYERFNEVYSDINGINLPQNKFYSPIRRRVLGKEPLENEFLGEISHRRAITPSAGKSRVKNIRALEQTNDIEIIQRHIHQVEHYRAWARKIRQLNGIFGDEKIRSEIQANFGKNLLRVLDRFIDDFTRGGIDRSSDMKSINLLKNNYTVAVLSGKLSITVKQLMSIPAFADSIPTGDFIAGIADLSIDTNKKLRILASSAFMRSRGLSITPEMAEAVNSKELSAFQLQPSMRNLLLTFTKWGDRGAIFIGGWAVYRYHREVLGKPHSEAIRAFADAASSSQQSADLSQQSQLQRGSSFQRLFGAFLSSPNQYFRKELSATEDMIAGRIDRMQWAKMMVIYHFLLPMLFQWAADGLEWRTKEQARAMILGSLNGIFILGNIFSGIISQALGLKAWQSSTIIDSVSREAMNLIKKVDVDNLDAESFFELIKSSGKVAGIAKGLPAQQAINLLEGFQMIYEARTAEDWEKGFKRIAGWSEFVVDQGPKGKKGAF